VASGEDGGEVRSFGPRWSPPAWRGVVWIGWAVRCLNPARGAGRHLSGVALPVGGCSGVVCWRRGRPPDAFLLISAN